MEYVVSVPDFDGHLPVLVTGRWLSSARLFQDGQPAPRTPKGRQVVLHRASGQEVIARIRPRGWLALDPVPDIEIDGSRIEVVAPLTWRQWLWSALPICLLFLGGALGAFVGAIALTINARLFRQTPDPLRAYVFTGLVSLGALVVSAVIGPVLVDLLFHVLG